MFTNPQLIMGLDMYLYGTKNFSVFTPDTAIKESKEKTFEFTSLINNHGLDNAPIDYDTPWSNYDIKFPIMYWRKSNQIHQWFVKNVQAGTDNCAEYSVGIDQLRLLSKTIEPALASTAAASEYMPTADGFFFGSQEYDSYYFDDLRSTKTKIDRLIAYQTAALDANNKRYANLAKYNGNMSDSEFEKHFPNLTKDVPFDDFVYWSSW